MRRSHRHSPAAAPARRRLSALAVGLSATLAAGTLAATGAAAGPPTAGPPAAPAGPALDTRVAVDLEAPSSSTARGEQFVVQGTATAPTADGRRGPGVPASFTLQVVDPAGDVLAAQEVTAAADGTFRTVVPGSATAGVPGAAPLSGTRTGPVLALRAVEASYDGDTAAVAGTEPLVLQADATGLGVENSFVSSVGWVKPGEEYPSRIIVTNATDAPVAGAEVTVTAPEGTTLTGASGPGTATVDAAGATWTLPSVPAAVDGVPGRVVLVLESTADTTEQNPEIVWRDLSTTAVLSSAGTETTVLSHGPKVIPPSENYDTARYGDRPFPVVPVQYTDRDYQATNTGDDVAGVINDPANPGSTFNLFQEMSIGQLFPEGTVPSEGLSTADFDYEPGFDFTRAQVGQTCGGTTNADDPLATPGSLLYPDRVTNGVYNLPGTTGYYGSDANGSALVGALGGVGALQNIDAGCGPTGKLVYDAAAIADPDIDYNDYDTDKDGVVDFFMAIFAGCGGNGASQLGAAACDYPSDAAPYDNIWPHSSSLEFYYTDPDTGLAGFTTDDQLKDLEGNPLWYTDDSYRETTTEDRGDALKVLVRVGPYNLNPETALDKASVISHEYGHSLGLPDFYSTGGRETYGDWNLMATDKSQNIDAFGRQELGWVVPQVLRSGSTTATAISDSKQDTGTITWQRPDGTPYTLTDGPDGTVRNSEMYVAKLPGRQLLDADVFEPGAGVGASASHAWWSGSGNDFGCSPDGARNLDLVIPGVADLPAGSTVELAFASRWDIEWDYDYGYVLTTTDGGETYTSHESLEGYTTSNTDPTAGNPNQNACQATTDNGITGTSASYAAGSEAADRKLGVQGDAVFLRDRYDISDLVGAAAPALRFSYATDPGLALPGWFIDDVVVTATTPTGESILLETDFESDGDPGDERVFNGGCREDLSTAQVCTRGWRYLEAGAESAQDHAYYLEMRDRSGFDLDGRGEADRGPVAWEAGLYLSYTDEAHGYGNTGTDDPPAQSPLDSVPEPGSSSPDLDDAAFTPAAGRSTYSDSGEGHVDNYSDPSSPSGDWEFRYDCLDFEVTAMSGQGEGPATSDGDLTGDVEFTLGDGCGEFDYGYVEGDPLPDNTAPTADARARPATVGVGEEVTLDASRSTDAETPRDLDYSWDFGDDEDPKDAAGAVVTASYDEPGRYLATVRVTDPSGAGDTATVPVTVTAGDGGDTTGPTVRMQSKPNRPLTGQKVRLGSNGTSDDTSAAEDLTYRWDFGNGGSRVDATGRDATVEYRAPGTRRVRLTVTDEAGNTSVRNRRLTVRRYVACGSGRVDTSPGWSVEEDDDALRGTWCTNDARRRTRDVLTMPFRGGLLQVRHGVARDGGVAKVFVDGERRGRVDFSGDGDRAFGARRVLTGLGDGRHTLRLVMAPRGRSYLEAFVTRR